MPNVGLFLLLSFFGPGIVISSCLLLLWPEVRSVVLGQENAIWVFLAVTIAFLNGHIPYLLERWVFIRIWDRMHKGLRLRERQKDAPAVRRLLIEEERRGIRHSQYEQIFGEFVFYFNSSFWLFLISGVRLVFLPDGLLLLATLVIFVSSVVSLIWTSALYKAEVLSVMKCMADAVACDPRPAVVVPVSGRPAMPETDTRG